MKENILHILNTGLIKLPESVFSITVNYKGIIERFQRKPITAEKIKFVEDELNKLQQINTFNITFEIRRGTDKIDEEWGDPIYEDNWKTVFYEFFGGSDPEDEDEEKQPSKIDYTKIAWFGYNRLGDESLNIHEKKWLYEFDYENEKRIWFNFFEYSKVDELMDKLIELDSLLDKQFEEKKIIADKLINTTKLLK